MVTEILEIIYLLFLSKDFARAESPKTAERVIRRKYRKE